VALLVGRWFSLPYHAMLTASLKKQSHQASEEKWAEKLTHVQRQQFLLKRSAEQSEKAERESSKWSAVTDGVQ